MNATHGGYPLLVYPEAVQVARVQAENKRLTKNLDLACARLAEQLETVARLNRMLDCACDELRKQNLSAW